MGLGHRRLPSCVAHPTYADGRNWSKTTQGLQRSFIAGPLLRRGASKMSSFPGVPHAYRKSKEEAELPTVGEFVAAMPCRSSTITLST